MLTQHGSPDNKLLFEAGLGAELLQAEACFQLSSAVCDCFVASCTSANNYPFKTPLVLYV